MGFSRRMVFRALAYLTLLVRLGRRRRVGTASVGEKRVTIIEPFGLGDVLSHEPLVRGLQGAGWRVTVCAPRAWRELLPGADWVDSAAPWGHHERAEKYSVREYLRPQFRMFLKTLRGAAAGSVGIDTRGDIRSVVLLYLAGCREVISVSKYLGTDLGLPRFVGTLVEFSPALRRWELNLRCLAPMDLEPRGISRPQIRSDQRVDSGSQRLVGIMPVAPWPGKWWQVDKWTRVITALRARGHEVVALCGPGQSGLTKEQVDSEVRILECATVAEWTRQLERLNLLITLDSGPMHLAEALGTPVVALFGQGLLPLWAPSHPQSEIVTHQSEPDFKVCLPSEANTAQGQAFMRRISVEEVIGAVERALARSR